MHGLQSADGDGFSPRCSVQDVPKELAARGSPPGERISRLSNARRDQHAGMSQHDGDRPSGFSL